MTIEIATASAEDIGWLTAHEHVPEDWIRRCVSHEEYLIARAAARPLGFLRFSWFWGAIPYMDLIYVLADARRQGVGSALFRSWEETMRRKGAKLLMTSSMSDEPEPQAWHRRNGFADSGSLTFGKLQEVPEAFFVKPLLTQ